LPGFSSGGKVQPSLGLVLAMQWGKTKPFGLVVVWLSQVLLGLTSRSKGRAARWRFWSLIFFQGLVASFKFTERRAPYRNVRHFKVNRQFHD